MVINEEKLNDLDAHWDEVAKLAEKYGFITQAYAGVSIIMTHKNQRAMWGDEKYAQRQKEMFHRDVTA